MPDIPSLQIAVAAALAGAVAAVAWRLRALTPSGAIAAFCIGTIVFGIGGAVAAVPLLVFFISASALSAVGRARKSAAQNHYAKTECRDASQVLANGGVPALLILFSVLTPNSRELLLLYLAGIAAANADTWATEIGGLAPGRPRLVTTWRVADRGESGAITLTGVLASLIGAAVVVASAVMVWPRGSLLFFARPDSAESLSVVWAAFVAACADSVLGAGLQGQYRCLQCNKIVEKPKHCGEPAKLVRGFRWLGNDLVNTISVAAAVLFALFLLHVFAYPT